MVNASGFSMKKNKVEQEDEEGVNVILKGV